MWLSSMHVRSLFLVSLLVLPLVSHAGHDRFDINRDDLDDEIVDTFSIPVLFGVEYEDINPDFGDPRGAGTRTHEGEDIVAPQGTPIVSPTEAIVVRTGEGDSSGLYVYTANPGGETFRYMHLDSIARNLERGDELDVGDFIGTVGDTGNAAPGDYHLHFEVRDEDNDATDPYPRIEKTTWSLGKKIQFLDRVFKNIRNDEEYAEIIVANFRSEMIEAQNAGYSLPDAVADILKAEGIVPVNEQLHTLELAFRKLPALISSELSIGDSGPQVAVLQLYLMFMSVDSSARSALRTAGPTGYFGSVTEAALRAYQKETLVAATGQFDTETKKRMLDAKDKLDLI